ncbi:2-C-methyl-D-erythritol 4-phosphate cytidylyltransferase [Candidatus Arthromitus sp. SFB-rat-Yit]|uniref:2-C-methyl-D-erythritol 4-phosphate cytidylyltransferase n=1 Tax=Candidatus Arthromitus sp. SFB-rat-Yit TaxID=1041504 RepID=UPI000227A821|nr:2-C-methyl-D-erythritol 4-phosphate cytidylyltransferase [Candidatus Arthromitus sp. SFB-rat-Yit]BAK81807.1 2-C-methyl-D-erythritol 4-phosphate cytidylyltransferase [Candidatus Arthromitus sp. SFB-rat-Yit]
MYKNSDCILLAAGRSRRMNSEINKQFMEINNKPVLYYSLNKILNNKYIDNIYLVLEDIYIEYCKKNILNKWFSGIDKIKIVIGGENRQDSVYNALNIVHGEYVLIHDAARPFLSDECISNAVKYANEYGASSCYVTPNDTIKFNNDSEIKTLKREKLLIIQTPQCFKKSKLICAYNYINKHGINVTDESSALDLIGEKTYFYLGNRLNIKITNKEDIYIGESIQRLF